MTLSWNIVTKNIHPHLQLQEKLREKISKVERHLQHFPPDAVHLQIALERHPRKPLFAAALTLKLPSNILRAEHSAADPIPAFDKSVKALLRELATLKSELRRESRWQRKPRRAGRDEPPLLRFADQPLPSGSGPQTLADLVSSLLERYHPRLLLHVQRQLWHDERAGDLPRAAIDAPVVVDEVARQVLSAPETKPANLSYRLWFYLLAKKELRRRYKLLEAQLTRTLPLDEAATPEEDGQHSEPDDAVQEDEEPPRQERRDLVPDTHSAQPDEEMVHKDFIRYLQEASTDWPQLEREVFALHFLEGFEAEEVAMLEKAAVGEVRTLIRQLQDRLRGIMAVAAEAEGHRLARAQ